MRSLSRLLLIVVLLCGLAFGSYRFGQTVLSGRILGKPATGTQYVKSSGNSDQEGTVSRSSSVRGKPQVEVDVLPADQTGDEPEPPASPSTRRQVSEPGDVVPDKPESIVTGDDPSITGSDSTEVEKPRRRKKKRRTEVKTEDRTPTADATPSAPSPGSDMPARRIASDDDSESSSTSSRSNSGDDSPRAPEPRPEGDRELAPSVPVDSTPDEAPKKKRRRERVKRVSTTKAAPRATVRRPARHVEDSPVPLPEGGGDSGGGSPVPLPE